MSPIGMLSVARQNRNAILGAASAFLLIPVCQADDPTKVAGSPVIQREVNATSAVPPVCVGWDKAWVVHRYSPADGKWQSWKSPEIAELPKRGAFSKATATQAVIVAPLNGYEGWRFEFEQQRWTKIPRSPIDGAGQGGLMYYEPVVVALLPELLFVWGQNRGPPHGSILEFGTDRWSLIPESPVAPRRRTLNALIGHKVIVWGGLGTRGQLDDGAVFDLQTQTWAKMTPAPMLQTAGSVGIAWNENLVLAGGKLKDRVAIYDSAAESWKLSPPGLFELESYPAIAAVGSKLFLWSGSDGNGKYRDNGLLYDLVSGKWEEVPAAPIAGRSNTFAAGFAERAIVWGGWRSGESIESNKFMRDAAEFDIKTRTWRRIADLPGDVPMHLHPGW